MNVYENCPSFEDETYLLRLTAEEDIEGLLAVYSDVKAVPFFNSDNCHGDDFHYATVERMRQAVEFWKESYLNGWFVRWTIIDKRNGAVAGTVEEFKRDAEDYFTDCGLLRLDLRSDYENCGDISRILSLISAPSFDMFGCTKVATKAIPVAVERRKALKALHYKLTDEKLVGSDGTKYDCYFVLLRE